MVVSKILCAVIFLACAVRLSVTQSEYLLYENLFCIKKWFAGSHTLTFYVRNVISLYSLFFWDMSDVFQQLYSLMFAFLIIIHQRGTCVHICRWNNNRNQFLAAPDSLRPQVHYISSTYTILLSVFLFLAEGCNGRCGAEYYRGSMCQCDYNCLLYGECCEDYESQCTTSEAFPVFVTLSRNNIFCDWWHFWPKLNVDS